jgi:hypothetical protein
MLVFSPPNLQIIGGCPNTYGWTFFSAFLFPILGGGAYVIIFSSFGVDTVGLVWHSSALPVELFF